MAGVVYKDSIHITVTNELKLFVRSMAAKYRFVFKQEQYDFVKRADMLELVELEEVGKLLLKIDGQQSESMTLSKKEVYTLYTMMELVCRSFLTEISDVYKQIAMNASKVTEERYNEVRSTELGIAQTLIHRLKEDFKEDPEFSEILERLEMLDN